MPNQSPLRVAIYILAGLSLLAGGVRADVKLDKGVTLDRHTCDKITWTDAAGLSRAIAIVPDHDRDKFWGGYIPWLSYTADGKVRECKETGGSLGGFGQLTFHGANPRGWGNSKEDTTQIDCKPIFLGAHHAIYRAIMHMNTSGGPVVGTVDYFVRDGRTDFVWAVAFDTSATNGLVADSRAPYCEFDWEGDGHYEDAISGFGWATAGKQFRTLDDKLTANAKWDYTKDCVIPHIIEWKTPAMGDAEMGLIQTQTYAQHDAGAGNWYQMGKTGQGLPENWNLTYQLNAYQGYATKKATWMLPYGAVGQESYSVFDNTRKASGKPYQSYALLCVFDKYSDAGVDGAVADVSNAITQGKLTATVGTPIESTPGGAGRTDLIKCDPVGWNQVYGAWSVDCAANSADCNLAVAQGTLTNAVFIFNEFTSDQAPAMSFNGKPMTADKDYFASVDTDGHRLFVTLRGKIDGAKNELAFKGAPNTTFPEISKPTVTPADGWEGEATSVTIAADLHDPNNSLQTVTVDLTALGGAADAALTGKGNGTWTITFPTGSAITPGQKSATITATNGLKHSAHATVSFEVKPLVTTYKPGILADFKDGTAQGWAAQNSNGVISQEQAFGDSKNSWKVTVGQYGACPILGSDLLTGAKTLKLQVYCVTTKPGDVAAIPLGLNGAQTKLVGPGDKGSCPDSKWTEITLDMSKFQNVHTIMLQTYGVSAIYIGQVWSDAVPSGKAKPDAAK